MDQIFHAAAQNWFWTVIGAIAVTGTVFGCMKSILRGHATERTRREIAAYIAEGSMTPEQGEKLMKARNEDDD